MRVTPTLNLHLMLQDVSVKGIVCRNLEAKNDKRLQRSSELFVKFIFLA